MSVLLSEITRSLARALSNPTLRALVYQEIQRSPYPENKLHFRSFLGDVGWDVAAAIADDRSRPVAELFGVLDSILDLEFYMPVQAHRQVWTGGDDLVVASVLFDDGTVPVAFDPSGKPVPIQSAAVPPSTPSLVIVPAETHFGDSQSRTEALQSVGGGDPQVGAYMTWAYVPGRP